jgi:tetratricopeptide (TPR) repeat protein
MTESHKALLQLIGNPRLSSHKVILYYKQTLKIYNREFGVDHIKSLNTIRNMGNIYGLQGKYEEAMPYTERELKIVEREFGVDHINSANTIMGIGTIYRYVVFVCITQRRY